MAGGCSVGVLHDSHGVLLCVEDASRQQCVGRVLDTPQFFLDGFSASTSDANDRMGGDQNLDASEALRTLRASSVNDAGRPFVGQVMDEYARSSSDRSAGRDPCRQDNRTRRCHRGQNAVRRHARVRRQDQRRRCAVLELEESRLSATAAQQGTTSRPRFLLPWIIPSSARYYYVRRRANTG